MYVMVNSIKVSCWGSRFHGGQIDRIEQGFRELGREVTPYAAEADLVYANDAGAYSQIVADKMAGHLKPSVKVIFTVLDLAPHLGNNFPLARIAGQLAHADAVTTISETVARDIKARLGIAATVVYNPIKPVVRDRVRRHPFRAMFVGRVSDQEKRSHVAAQALSILGFTRDDVVTVGNEPPYYGGSFWGVASDSTLNDLYNSVDFVMCPTRNAFLGLPALEGMAAGAIPVICNDMDIRWEFWPSSLFPEYDNVGPTGPAIAGFMASLLTEDGEALENLRERLYAHYVANWADRLSPIGVARSIIGVYEGLT